jgi:lipoyl(octanoyl) transferase
MSPHPCVVRDLGLVDYEPTWARMKAFTDSRTAQTPDEIWCLQHSPVFTQGLGGSPAHVLAPGDIPVIKTDRGGQVTYHGPGQLVVYLMLDLKRLGLGPRELVRRLENALILLLDALGLEGQRRDGAPGVYVAEAKIASLGLRVRRQCSYHGVALNVCNDLTPFSRINPCGYAGLQVTSLAQLARQTPLAQVQAMLVDALRTTLYFPGSEVVGLRPRALPLSA